MSILHFILSSHVILLSFVLQIDLLASGIDYSSIFYCQLYVLTMNDLSELMIPSDNIFDLKGEEFFAWIRCTRGEILAAVLEIQCIDSAQVLINSQDPFDIFKYDSPDINALREKVYFKTTTGCFVLKPGIEVNYNGLLNSLKLNVQPMKKAEDNEEEQHKYQRLFTDYPILESLFNWYAVNPDAKTQNHTFLASFIDTIVKNLNKHPNRYRYPSSIEKFALSLYILGGKTAYQFVRMNLSPGLPSVTTLNKLISADGSRVNESEFRFNSLTKYLDKMNIKFAFGSEDCTGVLKRITYDQETDSFIGFSSPLSNGKPIPRFYRTNSIDELKSWFEQYKKASLLNIHMVQPLPASNQINIPAAFLLAGYGVNNDYTSIDVLRRWLYIFEEATKERIRIFGFSTGMYLFKAFSPQIFGTIILFN